MSKIVDDNGFWVIKKNPISKEGVFPYLGHTISEDCEPNKIYKVYRSGKTLKESVPTWDNPPKPFIEDHEMLGEGFTAIDDRHVQGVISNPVYEDGVLYADIAVYSESLKEAIENGKKELSLGYFCKYKKEHGTFDGEEYDYVQEDMVGNHIALVDAGRCGSDVKVFDSRCTMDKFDVCGEDNLPLKKNAESGNIETKEDLTETKDETMADIRKKIQAILAKDSDDTEKVDELTELVEKTAKDEKADEEEKKAEDKCGKDEDDSEKKDDKKESEDEDDSESEKEEKKDTKAEDEDTIADIKAMIAEIKALLKSKSEDEDETKKSDEEKETEDEDESKEDEKKAEDEDESDDDKKKTEDSAVWCFGQDSAESGEDEAFANYLK